MTRTDRAEAILTARFLGAARSLDWLSLGLTFVAAGALAFGGSTRRNSAIAAVGFGLVARVYALRIAFDAGLFEDIANSTVELEDLDSAIVAQGLVPKKKIERPWRQRCRGARRLVKYLGLVTLAQVALFIWMSLVLGDP